MKSVRIVFFLFAAIFLASVPAWATPRDADLLRARDLIYNADFNAASALIDAHIKANSDDPYGYILRGMLLDWQQIVGGRYHEFDDRIFDSFDKARIKAQVASDEDRNNIDKKIALGHALMYVSKKMLDRGQSFRAGGYLKHARDIMVYVQMQEPDNPEVSLALGVFHYYSDNVPKNLKWLAGILGFSGDAKTGLDYMRKASNYDNFSRHDAKFLLSYTLFRHEKSYAEALQHNDSLRALFPNNPEFLLMYAEIAARKKDHKEALVRYQKLDAFCSATPCAKRYAFLTHYYQADLFKKLGDMDSAALQAQAALADDTGKENSRIVTLHHWLLEFAEKKNDEKTVCSEFRTIEEMQKYNIEVWEKVKGKHDECGKV